MSKYLTACLMFKDSAIYLEEWLRFHLHVGFEHFYLYDNDSSDDYRSVIQPFIDAGKITLHSWPGDGQMAHVFAHCLATYRTKSRWMAFLDDDEFLFPVEGESLVEVLPRYEDYAGVAVCWLLFGSGGHRVRPPGLVIENYRLREAAVNKHVKCVVDPSRVSSPGILAHSFNCLPGEHVVDENFNIMEGFFATNPSANILCINHYISKSLEEIISRRSRLTACGKTVYTLDEYIASDANLNEVEDPRIQRFVPSLQQERSIRFRPSTWARRCSAFRRGLSISRFSK